MSNRINISVPGVGIVIDGDMVYMDGGSAEENLNLSLEDAHAMAVKIMRHIRLTESGSFEIVT